MQTISTKVLPWTDTKPTRVKATASGAKLSVTVCGASDSDHIRAAKELKEQLNWTGPMQGGSTKDGMVFVFIDEREPRI